jgi:hypothetical protein
MSVVAQPLVMRRSFPPSRPVPAVAAATNTASNAAAAVENKTDLEAEIQRLEEELARKRLEEEIRLLELQLQAAQTAPPPATAGTAATSNNNNNATGVEDEYEDEEYIVIEELVSDDEYEEEEYYEDEEIIEEEIVEEEEVIEEPALPQPDAPSPPAPVAAAPPVEEARSAPTPPAPAPRPDYPPKVPLVDEPPKAAPPPAPATASPRKQWVPLSQRKPELFQKGPNVVMAPGKNSTTTPGSRPPIKFTPRKIPHLPESPKGQETIMEQLLGPKLITNAKLVKMSTVSCLKDQTLVCLYFGAGWRTECKQFNPFLSDFYKLVAQPHNLECVYIPADRTLFEFKDCYARMPYLALPAGTTALKNELTKQLKVVDLPTLVVMDPHSGQVITTQGAEQVMALENRNPEPAMELVQSWKMVVPVPIADLPTDKRLKHGNLQRGTVYWQE